MIVFGSNKTKGNNSDNIIKQIKEGSMFANLAFDENLEYYDLDLLDEVKSVEGDAKINIVTVNMDGDKNFFKFNAEVTIYDNVVLETTKIQFRCIVDIDMDSFEGKLFVYHGNNVFAELYASIQEDFVEDEDWDLIAEELIDMYEFPKMAQMISYFRIT